MCTDIHGPQRVNSDADPLTFPLAAPADQRFHLTSGISQHQIEWIGTTFCTDIHGPHMMNPNDFAELMVPISKCLHS